MRTYFDERGQEEGVLVGDGRLAAVALIGHVCDVTMGMALIPVSRHSALASFFKLSVSSTLAFYMLATYALLGLVQLHGFLYIFRVSVFSSLSGYNGRSFLFSTQLTYTMRHSLETRHCWVSGEYFWFLGNRCN